MDANTSYEARHQNCEGSNQVVTSLRNVRLSRVTNAMSAEDALQQIDQPSVSDEIVAALDAWLSSLQPADMDAFAQERAMQAAVEVRARFTIVKPEGPSAKAGRLRGKKGRASAR